VCQAETPKSNKLSLGTEKMDVINIERILLGLSFELECLHSRHKEPDVA